MVVVKILNRSVFSCVSCSSLKIVDLCHNEIKITHRSKHSYIGNHCCEMSNEKQTMAADFVTHSIEDSRHGAEDGPSTVTHKSENVHQDTGHTHSLSRRARRRIQRNEMAKMMKKPKKPNQDPGFDRNYFSETDYYFENGLRKVYPYYFTFKTHAKGRWVKRSLVDVLTSEFHAESVGSYKKSIESGKIKVNGKPISEDYVIKDNDFISNTVHRHESSVSSEMIQVIEQNDDMVVVNKPSSIPVHPCGRYRHNSVVFILGKEQNLTNLRTIYRLDRMTSGVLLFTRTHGKTAELMNQMKNRLMKKTYLCRVVGEFPSGIIECREPLTVLSHKVGLFRVAADGKESWTTFQRLSYNGKSSVVKCQPHTGRTHQIRVHLQYLGHPIVNDGLYNSDAWGPLRGKGGVFDKPEEKLIEDIIRLHNRDNHNENVNKSPVLEDISGLDNLSSSSSKLSPKNEDEKNPMENDDKKMTETSKKVSEDNEMSNDITEHKQLPANESCQNPHPTKHQNNDIGAALDPHCNHGNTTAVRDSKESVENDITIKDSRTPQTASDTSNKPVLDDCASCPPRKKVKLDSSSSQDPGVVVDPDCFECQQSYKDPKPEDLVMFLHALSYEGPDWKYSTDPPMWASENWEEQ